MSRASEWAARFAASGQVSRPRIGWGDGHDDICGFRRAWEQRTANVAILDAYATDSGDCDIILGGTSMQIPARYAVDFGRWLIATFGETEK